MILKFSVHLAGDRIQVWERAEGSTCLIVSSKEAQVKFLKEQTCSTVLVRGPARLMAKVYGLPEEALPTDWKKWSYLTECSLEAAIAYLNPEFNSE